MSEADKTFGKCPSCGENKLFTGRWASENPTLANGKKACIECKVDDIYNEFLKRRQTKDASS